ncbi:LuxR C-terminal-related transcriptional regulator [Actinomadura roseirufa]|uniref:LuxR C-terminal-related transcriptional regulator n=1 Tax=Actinomadura roseirufa TaxID=2094049 RepID=UPI001041686A|nr:response regulator transcription factor [Actinomadura roseirufa]
MRVLVADPDPTSRRWVRRILDEDAAHELVGDAADSERAIEIADRTAPDVVLLSRDLSSDDQALADRLISRCGAAVILVGATGNGSAVWHGVNGGAIGYLLKDRLGRELHLALRAAETGGTFISPPLFRQLVGYLGSHLSQNQANLTATEIRHSLLPRELETLYRLSIGQSTQEIAQNMAIAPATVRAYVSRLLGKLGLRNRGEAIALAYRSGFYAPERMVPEGTCPASRHESGWRRPRWR